VGYGQLQALDHVWHARHRAAQQQIRCPDGPPLPHQGPKRGAVGARARRRTCAPRPPFIAAHPSHASASCTSHTLVVTPPPPAPLCPPTHPPHPKGTQRRLQSRPKPSPLHPHPHDTQCAPPPPLHSAASNPHLNVLMLLSAVTGAWTWTRRRRWRRGLRVRAPSSMLPPPALWQLKH